MNNREDASGTGGTTRSTLVRMPCRLGLHARTAAMFLRFVSRFESEIRIRKGAVEADGKSILGLLMLGACWGCPLHIEVEGSDADTAIREIENYFRNDEHCADNE
jgi:phosphocarrier protein